MHTSFLQPSDHGVLIFWPAPGNNSESQGQLIKCCYVLDGVDSLLLVVELGSITIMCNL